MTPSRPRSRSAPCTTPPPPDRPRPTTDRPPREGPPVLTLDQLIDNLTDLRSEIAADVGDSHTAGATEVRLATQAEPSPLQHHLSDREPGWALDPDGRLIACLADGGQVRSAPFLPAEAAALL